MADGVVIVTGAAGLVGSEACRYFHAQGFDIVGIDNDMRSRFFGEDASTKPTRRLLDADLANFQCRSYDIRDPNDLHVIGHEFGSRTKAIIHAAAQPSHDWAASNPPIDFAVNALGTLNLLEMARKFCPTAAFVFTSTNKVYGDYPNRMSYCDHGKRFEPMFGEGENASIKEYTFPIDQTTHSVFGCSKLAADLLVQEYGRYFKMPTVCFRGGCLTGPQHAGTKLHGFLSYLVKCAVHDIPYQVIGYGGKQVRDNIHSHDLVRAFDCFIKSPKAGAVYNIGGGRENSCSVLEAIESVETMTGKKMQVEFVDQPRIGDHKWWITDNSKFQRDYPEWKIEKRLHLILAEMIRAEMER